MGTFLGFLLVVSVIVWGTAFTALHFRRQLKGPERGADSELLARLLDDMDQLSTRLSRVEEDLDFFKELRSPESQSRLSPPPDRREGESPTTGETGDKSP